MAPWQNGLLLTIPIVVALAMCTWARRDFKAWTALGKGGLPHTPAGWLAMTGLRLFKRDGIRGVALDAVLNQPDDAAYLGHLMQRSCQQPSPRHGTRRTIGHSQPVMPLTQTVSSMPLDRQARIGLLQEAHDSIQLVQL